MTGEDRAARILGAWQRAREQGTAPPPADVIRRHPELEDELRAGFAMVAALDEVYANDPRASGDSSALPGDSADAPGEEAGDVIGKYRLLQQIGEGGMGTVWMADQLEPVKRRVALKIIKLGMDTKQVVARFEAERQALAMLDHPNIAKVLDGGSTATGRPFFVMDLVKGVPVTEFADEARLSIPERLELFLQVCDAITHAHAKGLIHRDIKPSNVMVTLHDGKPVVRVIDFGIAKATNQELTQKTLFTALGQIIGTPEYMAPEQASMSGLDVDTRADVYSLGALLYELLTGCKPFDLGPLLSKGYGQMLRTIREQDPPMPSTRASTAEDDAGRISIARQLSEGQLSRRLRGDLDWIVVKAMDKDRSRRYATANGLARDIERHLEDEPVSASPPSRTYRVRKFVRRHRGPVVAAALVTIALLLGVTGLAVGLAQAVSQRERAEEAEQRTTTELARATEVKQLITDMLRAVGPAVALGEDTALLERVLEDTSARLLRGEIEDELVAAELHAVVGGTYYSLGLLDRAEPHVAAAREIRERVLGPDHPASIRALGHDAWLHLDRSRSDEADRLIDLWIERSGRVHGEDALETLYARSAMARARRQRGYVVEGERLSREVLERARELLGPDDERLRAFLDDHSFHVFSTLSPEVLDRMKEAADLAERLYSADDPRTLTARAGLGMAHLNARNLDAAERILEDVHARQVRIMGAAHPETLRTVVARSRVAILRRDYDKAGRWIEEGGALARKHLGDLHVQTLRFDEMRAHLTYWTGDREEAVAIVEGALEVAEEALGQDHLMTVDLLRALADFHARVGEMPKAIPVLRRARESRRRMQGANHPITLGVQLFLAQCLGSRQEWDEALRLGREAVRGLETALGADHPTVIHQTTRLVHTLANAGRNAEAETLARRALDTARESLGEDDAVRADAVSALSQVLGNQLRYAEALPLIREALPIVEAREGPTSERVLRLKHDLVFALTTTGQGAEAERVARDGLAHADDVVGEALVGKSGLLLALGVALADQGRRKEAVPFVEASYAIVLDRRGETALETLNTAEQLASMRIDAGTDLRRPIRELEHLLEVHRRLGGEITPDTVRLGVKLALTYVRQLRPQDGMVLIRRYAPHGELLAARHRPLLEAANRWMRAHGEKRERLADVYARVDARETELAGSSAGGDDDLIEALMQDGRMAWGAGRMEEARLYFGRAMRRIRRDHAGDHPLAIPALEGSMFACLHLERWQEAETCSVEALARHREAPAADSINVFAAMTNLGLVYLAQQRFEEARKLLEQSVEGKRRVLPRGHQWLISALTCLANAYEGLGRLEDSLPYRRDAFEQTVELARQPAAPPKFINDTAWALLTYPVESLRDPETARSLAEEACRREEEAGGAHLGQYLDTLALAHFQLGDAKLALEQQRRALKLSPDEFRAEMQGRLEEYEAAVSDEGKTD